MAEDASGRAAATPLLRGFGVVGTTALVGLVVLVLSLSRLVALDDRVWGTVLVMRGCATDVAVDRTVDFATRVLTALFVVAALLHVRTHGARSTWPWVGASMLGLFASKTLKHILTRERPSSLPDIALGYSFPSAHVMNSVAAMLAVIALSHGFRRRNLWSIVAGLLTVTVTVGRVLLGRHWACDVIGGGLAALVLVGLVVPALVRRPVAGPTLLTLVLAVAFMADHWVGNAGLTLPAPLIGSRLALVDVDVGEPLRPALVGAWKEAADDRAVGSLVWLEGSGTIPMDVPEAVVRVADDQARRSLRLAFGGRTETDLSSCLSLGVDLNGQPLARFVPFSGWREYRLAIPPGLLHAGRNELALSAETRGGPARFAVTYVRVAAGSTAD
jgi:membrane-associated phospholipid phosphatase